MKKSPVDAISAVSSASDKVAPDSHMMTMPSSASTEDVLYSFYHSLSDNMDTFPIAEPDECIITPLHKHQKQALYFMLQREACIKQVLPIENTRDMTSLWRRDASGRIFHIITGQTWNQQEEWEDYFSDDEQDVKKNQPFHIRGGILADDMGLGKTLEMIALLTFKAENNKEIPLILPKPTIPLATTIKPITKNMSFQEFKKLKDAQRPATDLKSLFHHQKKIPSPPKMEPPSNSIYSKATLIVCPLSTVSNWEEQLCLHVKPGHVSFYVHHGPQRSMDASVIARHNVVITTYSILAVEYNRSLKSNDASILHRIHWRRIVLDEAHMIKDASTQQAKAACALFSRKRWCLTGTPIQNKVEDVFSLMKFLQVYPFSDKTVWNQYFKHLHLDSSMNTSALQLLMKSLTLRRTKTSMIDNRPILSLPLLSEKVVSVAMTDKEWSVYKNIEQRAISLLESDSALMNYINVLELILRLRQACVHSSLVKLSDSFHFDQQRANEMMALLQEQGEDQCSQCGYHGNDEEGRGMAITQCGHVYCEVCVKDVSNNECLVCHGPSTLYMLDTESNNTPALSGQEEPSSKFKALFDHLDQLKTAAKERREAMEKCIIFSQWTSVLDRLAFHLDKLGYKWMRLDGRMNRQERHSVLSTFRQDPQSTLLLLSLRAGGVGLNLTCASRVFMMEPYWNPAVEQQAIDRVYRLGQIQPVFVVRFIVPGSIEDRLVASQQLKQQLLHKAFHGSNRKRSVEEMNGDKNIKKQAQLESMRVMLLGGSLTGDL